MSPSVTLVRHGKTEWSASGRHTGRTDIPLTEEGERKARGVSHRLKGAAFDRVFTSPLQRASRTCALAGFGDRAVVDADLLEWNYGDYEGRTTKEILERRPGWLLFATDARTSSSRLTWPRAPIASSPAFAQQMTARSCSRAVIS
jgi:broad specificity phosphatase PhoE